jgi:hypothetical protein
MRHIVSSARCCVLPEMSFGEEDARQFELETATSNASAEVRIQYLVAAEFCDPAMR